MDDLIEVKGIDDEIAALQAKKKLILDEKRTDALAKAKALVHTFGFTASELEIAKPVKVSKSAKDSKSNLEPKYQNPANAEETWHGSRGAKPKWVREFLDNNGKLEDILIKK